MLREKMRPLASGAQEAVLGWGAARGPGGGLGCSELETGPGPVSLQRQESTFRCIQTGFC